ncbi:MAG: hypothetical protein H6772_00990 [Pseudomonadales bacterium]|nr:hypothetical protein [Pseudomonadales bacterium]
MKIEALVLPGYLTELEDGNKLSLNRSELKDVALFEQIASIIPRTKLKEAGDLHTLNINDFVKTSGLLKYYAKNGKLSDKDAESYKQLSLEDRNEVTKSVLMTSEQMMQAIIDNSPLTSEQIEVLGQLIMEGFFLSEKEREKIADFKAFVENLPRYFDTLNYLQVKFFIDICLKDLFSAFQDTNNQEKLEKIKKSVSSQYFLNFMTCLGISYEPPSSDIENEAFIEMITELAEDLLKIVEYLYKYSHLKNVSRSYNGIIFSNILGTRKKTLTVSMEKSFDDISKHILNNINPIYSNHNMTAGFLSSTTATDDISSAAISAFNTFAVLLEKNISELKKE